MKWCLTTSVSEKKIRQAARNLFHQINKTHKDVISREEYLEAISGLTDSIRQQKLLAAAGNFMLILSFWHIIECKSILMNTTDAFNYNDDDLHRAFQIFAQRSLHKLFID